MNMSGQSSDGLSVAIGREVSVGPEVLKKRILLLVEKAFQIGLERRDKERVFAIRVERRLEEAFEVAFFNGKHNPLWPELSFRGLFVTHVAGLEKGHEKVRYWSLGQSVRRTCG